MPSAAGEPPDPPVERAVSIVVDTDRISDWTVDEAIFGSLSEHFRGVAYPGIVADYLVNGSFEVWNISGDSPETSGVINPAVPEYDGVAYPWEPVAARGTVTFELVEGGVGGRRDESTLDGDPEVPPQLRPDPPGVSGPRFQRISMDGGGGVVQWVALPDDRTTAFDLTLTVRGEGVGDALVTLQAPGDGVVASATILVGTEWAEREVRLDLGDARARRYRDTRFGEYELVVESEGDGHLDLDRSALYPADAVDGTFNPTTVDLLREFDVTTIRWPGGNFASQYRWRDGVGPDEDRPVVPILNWSGLERNALGTNEFLAFCELVDAEPYVTVPFRSAVGPEGAADWVEYCNGSTDTEMGALRADHGHPEPWGVHRWGVGNEVWGDWQVGHTDAASYAAGFADYADAMYGVDPDIEIDAVGVDPWFTDVHDGSDAPGHEGEPPVWNEICFDEMGEALERLDLHRYVVGIRGDDAARSAWCDRTGEDPVGYDEILVNFPAVYDQLLASLRQHAAEAGHPDLGLTIGEWNAGPVVNEGWPSASIGTMAHAVFAARMFQTFVKHGDAIDAAYWTDYTHFVHPRPDRVLPPHPGAYVQRAFARPIREADGGCRRVDTRVVDPPTRPFRETGSWSRPAGDVGLVEAVTVDTPDGTLHSLVTNGSMTDAYAVGIDFGDREGTVGVTLFAPVDGDPFRTNRGWDDPDGFAVDRFEVPVEDGTARLALPAASVAVVATDPAATTPPPSRLRRD